MELKPVTIEEYCKTHGHEPRIGMSVSKTLSNGEIMAGLEIMQQRREARIEEFKSFGVQATRGQFVGTLVFSAVQADKLLRALRKLQSLEAKKIKY